MNKIMIRSLIILVLTSTLAFASEKLTGSNEAGLEEKIKTRLLITDLLQSAWANNPQIASANQSYRQALEKYRIDKAYPDPQLMMTYFPQPIETRLGPQDWNLNLSQAIPFPGKLSGKGDVAASEIRVAKLTLDKTVKSIYTDIVVTYQELYYIRKAIETARKNHGLATKLLQIGETFYTDGQANFYDISKARAQIAQIEYDILLLEELENTEKIKLNALLNRAPDDPLGPPGQLRLRKVPYSLKELLALYDSNHEDMQIADERIEQSETKIQLSKLDRLPDFRFGLFYAGIGQPDVAKPPAEAGDDAVGIQFGVNIPIWSGKNNGRIKSAVAGKKKAQHSKESARNSARTQISSVWFKIKNAERLIELYEKSLLPQAVNSLQTAETWYREGKGSLSDFLEIQATVYNYRVSLERAKTDYNQMFAKLELLVGIPLDEKTSGKLQGGAA